MFDICKVLCDLEIVYYFLKTLFFNRWSTWGGVTKAYQ